MQNHNGTMHGTMQNHSTQVRSLPIATRTASAPPTPDRSPRSHPEMLLLRARAGCSSCDVTSELQLWSTLIKVKVADALPPSVLVSNLVCCQSLLLGGWQARGRSAPGACGCVRCGPCAHSDTLAAIQIPGTIQYGTPCILYYTYFSMIVPNGVPRPPAPLVCA